MFKTRLRDKSFIESLERQNVNRKFLSFSLASQNSIEMFVGNEYIESLRSNIIDQKNPLLVDKHRLYASTLLLKKLPYQSEVFDSNRPWLVFWSLRTLTLLNERISDEHSLSIIKFLESCKNDDGGFGGGPLQQSHLAPTYASVHALAILQNEQIGYEIIDRIKIKEWFKQLKRDDGSFALHLDGEVDLRAVYCVVSCCDLLNLLDDDLFENTTEWILSCQTYEGGFGGTPGNESHGGYSYCGIASLAILDKLHLCNLAMLKRWVVFRQMSFEGGFQGRTNKLVDSCYSFWIGASVNVCNKYFESTFTDEKLMKGWTFDEVALRDYILFVSQCKSGGFKDKPGKPADAYHTCYALSGLSLVQDKLNDIDFEMGNTHPYYNISTQAVDSIKRYFYLKNNE